MPTGLLDLFKYVLIALIWLFFLRVLRAVWVQIKEPKREKPRDLANSSKGLSQDIIEERISSQTIKKSQNSTSKNHGATETIQARQPSIRLKLLGGLIGNQDTYDITGIGTIGRGSGCTIPIPVDEFSSMVHARIYGQNGQFYIEDLESTNGTFVNNAKIDNPTALVVGDHILIGRTNLEVVR